MLKKFKYQAITAKIKLGVRYLVFLILGLSLVSILSFIITGYSFQSFQGVSDSTNLMGRIQANILEARLSALKFIRTGNNQEIGKFSKRIEKSNKFINQAIINVDNDKNLQTLNKIKLMIKKYSEGFDNVVKIKSNRNEIVYNKLNILGPKLEKDLTYLIQSLVEKNNSESAFKISMSLRSLMLARLYQAKFLDTNTSKDFERVVKEFNDFSNLFKSEKVSINKLSNDLFDGVWSMKIKYLKSFKSLYNLILERNKIIKNELDTFGPLIAKYSEEIKLSNKSKQESIGGTGKAVLIVFIVMFVVFSVVSYFFGKFISRELIFASDRLKVSIRELTEKISHSYAEIMGLNSELLNSSDSINELVDEQKSASQQTASAATQTTQTVNGVQELVKESNVFSSKIKNSIDDASTKMNNLVEAMKDIEKSNERIQNLSLMMKEVREKIGIIDDIVFQTKLLSFNASVEAARAGENGKGFSVVAEEIGNLASMSGNSAAEISEIISRNTEEVDKIVVENSKNIQRGIDFVQSTSEKLEEITTNSDSNMKSMESIMVSSEQQYNAVSEITTAIRSLDTGSSNLSSLSNNNKSIVKQLNTEASNLENTLELLSGLTSNTKKSA